MDKLYPQAIIDHVQECVDQLDELAEIVQARNLSTLEYRASERLLQLLIESAIGVAKHWLKALDQTAPANAYQCFSKLAQRQLITDVQLQNWKKMIGLRNALVHDYLNIDPEIITSILRNRYYLDALEFVQQGCGALKSNPTT